MKVHTEGFCEQWTDSLSIRLQLALPSETSNTDTIHDEFVEDDRVPAPPRTCEFLRALPAGLMALRNLPVEAPLLLFTPFLVPAGSIDTVENQDPFERLGRELAEHHPNIWHVPYVTSVGLTETHLDFIRQTEAVITVVCEPNHAMKKESMTEQHEFAEAALDAFVSRPTKFLGGGEFVLVQCATDDTRPRAHFAFANVLETSFYNDRTATYLADMILGHV